MSILWNILAAAFAVFGFYSLLYRLIGRVVGRGSAVLAVRAEPDSDPAELSARLHAVRLWSEEYGIGRGLPIVLLSGEPTGELVSRLFADRYEIFLRYPEGKGEPDVEGSD